MNLRYNDQLKQKQMSSQTKTQNTARKVKVRIPHITIDARGADAKLIAALENGLSELEAKICVIGANLEGQHVAFSVEESSERADIWLCLGKELPTEFSLLASRGIVPVMHEDAHPAGVNYSPTQEDGNAFLFSEFNEWRVFTALVRAIENYAFPYDWKNLKNHAKELSA